MSVRGVPSRTGDQAGLSLPEVIIATAVSALVLTILGSLFFSGFKTQAAVTGRDAATGAAAVVSNSVQTAVRNASNISVSGALLKARVTTGTATWQCVAWALTPDNKLVYKSSSAAITSTDYSAWTVLAVGASGRLSGGGAFTGTSTQVNFSLAFTSGGITVPVAGVATANAYGTGSPESCW